MSGPASYFSNDLLEGESGGTQGTVDTPSSMLASVMGSQNLRPSAFEPEEDGSGGLTVKTEGSRTPSIVISQPESPRDPNAAGPSPQDCDDLPSPGLSVEFSADEPEYRPLDPNDSANAPDEALSLAEVFTEKQEFRVRDNFKALVKRSFNYHANPVSVRQFIKQRVRQSSAPTTTEYQTWREEFRKLIPDTYQGEYDAECEDLDEPPK